MLCLDDIQVGELVVLDACELPLALAQWVGAIGLADGEELELLQRAPAGGPLHVRTTSGVELAVARDVARALLVRRV